MPESTALIDQNGVHSKVYNVHNRENGLFGDGGIRLTGMWVLGMAILAWFGILGTGELKDNWHENRGAEIVDKTEIKILRNAEKKLGKKSRNVEDVDEGWMGYNKKSSKKNDKRTKRRNKIVKYDDEMPNVPS